MKPDLLLADAVLSVHLLFIVWVICGWVFTRRRPWLRGIHIACVVYGIFIEVSNLTCPLTWLENRLEARGGIQPSRQPFILHLLEALVYPNVSLWMVVVCSVAVCAAILAIYWTRYTQHKAGGW